MLMLMPMLMLMLMLMLMRFLMRMRMRLHLLVPPSDGSARSARSTPTAPSGGGLSRSVWRPPPSRSSSAATPESACLRCAAASWALLAPVASHTAVRIALEVMPRGTLSGDHSGRRRWPPACGSFWGARR